MPLPDLFGGVGLEEPLLPSSRKRQLVVVITLVAGAAGLAATLRTRPGSLAFSVLGLVVAAIWCAGALTAGPARFRSSPPSAGRTVILALAVGGGTFLFFLTADLIGQHLPLIGPALKSILTKADAGNKALILAVALLNGVGEEVFFRGVLYDTLPERRIAWSTGIYVVVTAATGNIALIVAALVMGVVFSLERRSSRGVMAPLLTHVSWSTLMLLCLPR